MDRLLKSISYVFHPLIMPFLGVIFYFLKSPIGVPLKSIQEQIVLLFIATVILPVLLYYLLKIIGVVKTINLKTAEERIYPLMLNSIIILILLKQILIPLQIIELYFFFIGVLISNIVCLFFAIMRFKASIHMIAASGVFVFFMALSNHFKININGTLSLMVVIMGAIATSRLHLKAHTYKELIFGVCIGGIPQLILMGYSI